MTPCTRLCATCPQSCKSLITTLSLYKTEVTFLLFFLFYSKFYQSPLFYGTHFEYKNPYLMLGNHDASSCEKKIQRELQRPQIYTRDIKLPIPPRVMASSAMGLNFGVFGFLPTSKSVFTIMPHKVKTQYVHCRSIASYFLSPWGNPAK